MAELKKGDRVRYAGPYEAKVPESSHYPPGVVTGFRRSRWDDSKLVIVKLDGEDAYADWPSDELEKVSG